MLGDDVKSWLPVGWGVGISVGSEEAGGNSGNPIGDEEVRGVSAAGVGIFGGGTGGAAEAARVTISTFIPRLQCPILPQMKYRLPGEMRGTGVVPPDCI